LGGVIINGEHSFSLLAAYGGLKAQADQLGPNIGRNLQCAAFIA